jgi:hypothetical protein
MSIDIAFTIPDAFIEFLKGFCSVFGIGIGITLIALVIWDKINEHVDWGLVGIVSVLGVVYILLGVLVWV